MKYIFLLLFISACTIDRKHDEKPSDPFGTQKHSVVTLIFQSESDSLYYISKDLTIEEVLRGEKRGETMESGDTLLFPLDDSLQLIYGDIPMKLGEKMSLLVKEGDTVHIQIDGEAHPDIYRLVHGRKESVLWYDSLLSVDHAIEREKKDLHLVFLIPAKGLPAGFLMPNQEKKSKWKNTLVDYIKVSDQYYHQILDSLGRLSGKEGKLYRDLILRKRFMDFDWVNSLVGDSALANRLEKEYMTADKFSNRYFTADFGVYFSRNYTRNRGIVLTEAYNGGFLEYPEELRQYFKYRTIQSMAIKKYDRGTVINYIDKYKEEYGTVSPLEGVMKDMEYGVVEDSDLVLQDHNGKEVKWEKLREQWKGDIIYVDFWASWCAPCIRAMPYSKELKQKLEGKAVTFAYLAFNDQEKPWKAAVLRHGVEDNSYLIRNSKSSKFVGQVKLSAIPRYMIYDRDGNLVHQDAPGPDQKEALEVLTKYLEK